MCSPRRRSSAWICWALQKPGRFYSAAASTAACLVPRTLVPRGGVPVAGSGFDVVTTAPYTSF